jgi:2-iminobutanoate/2-iminopropanoate deaminase
MLTRLAVLFLLTALGARAEAADPDRQYIGSEQTATPTSPPISSAVKVGDTLYISGHLGVDPKNNRAPEDPKSEAKLVMERVKHTVESAGMTMNDVVTVQIYCTDLALYDTFNDVYRSYFTRGFPARAFLGTNALLRGAHFEVLGVAVRRQGAR